MRAFAGFSKKGYAPYNPRKRNQDAMLMEEDKKTGTLLFGVFDGHGEAGDLVSQFFTSRLPSRLFASPKWGPDPAGALVEELDKVERTLLAGESRGGRRARPSGERAARAEGGPGVELRAAPPPRASGCPHEPPALPPAGHSCVAVRPSAPPALVPKLTASATPFPPPPPTPSRLVH